MNGRMPSHVMANIERQSLYIVCNVVMFLEVMNELPDEDRFTS